MSGHHLLTWVRKFVQKHATHFCSQPQFPKMICMNCSLRPRLAAVSSNNGNTMVQAAMQRYAIVHAAMTQKAGLSRSGSRAGLAANASYGNLPPQQSLQQQVHWRSDGSMSALAYAGPEYELYALFDAMTDKDTATRTCQRLSVWIKGQQSDLFMPL